MLLYLLIGVWATVVITRSQLFGPIRSAMPEDSGIYNFIICPLCVGTWVGAFLGFVAVVSGEALTPVFNLVLAVVGMAAGVSLASYLLVLVIDVFNNFIWNQENGV